MFRAMSQQRTLMSVFLFDGVKRNTLIRVRCWLIARNIHVDFEKKEGSTQFEILYD